MTYDEVSELAAKGGFPVKYPHWQWGMEYEEAQIKIEALDCVFGETSYLYCLDEMMKGLGIPGGLLDQQKKSKYRSIQEPFEPSW